MFSVHQAESTRAQVLLTPRPATPRFASILIHAGLSRRSDALVAAAADLANVFGAKLIGVSTPLTPRARADISGVEVAAIERLIEASGERFAALSSAVRGGFLWRRADGSPMEALSAFGWAADLIIVDPSSVDEKRSGFDDIEGLLASTGRPVLVRPCSAPASRFDRIVVMWDDSEACRRAITAALPFLGRATRITLAAPPWGARHRNQERRLEDAQRGLLARGLPINLARRPASHAPAHYLGGVDADLVVMGCSHEHARWGSHGSPAAIPALPKISALVSC